MEKKILKNTTFLQAKRKNNLFAQKLTIVHKTVGILH